MVHPRQISLPPHLKLPSLNIMANTSKGSLQLLVKTRKPRTMHCYSSLRYKQREEELGGWEGNTHLQAPHFISTEYGQLKIKFYTKTKVLQHRTFTTGTLGRKKRWKERTRFTTVITQFKQGRTLLGTLVKYAGISTVCTVVQFQRQTLLN